MCTIHFNRQLPRLCDCRFCALQSFKCALFLSQNLIHFFYVTANWPHVDLLSNVCSQRILGICRVLAGCEAGYLLRSISVWCATLYKQCLKVKGYIATKFSKYMYGLLSRNSTHICVEVCKNAVKLRPLGSQLLKLMANRKRWGRLALWSPLISITGFKAEALLPPPTRMSGLGL